MLKKRKQKMEAKMETIKPTTRTYLIYPVTAHCTMKMSAQRASPKTDLENMFGNLHELLLNLMSGGE